MSYFNSDQVSWMNYLASLPMEKKCKCGWDLKGKCFNNECVEEHKREEANKTKEITAEQYADAEEGEE